MNTIDVENLSHAELKSRREEIVESLKGNEDLAARYVKARTDAAYRDEKLAEQGTTITSLNGALESANHRIASLEQELVGSQEKLSASVDSHSIEMERQNELIEALQKDNAAESEKYSAAVEKLEAELQEERNTSARMKAAAVKNEKAINAAAKELNDAIAARIEE
jgi:chromosome segregation ATPase